MWLWGYAPLVEFPGPMPDREYLDVLRGDPCAYCGGESDSLDHITATRRGGADEWSNLTAACRSCNTSKGAKPMVFALLGPGAYPSRAGKVRSISIPAEMAVRLRYVSEIIGVTQTRIIERAIRADLGEPDSIAMLARWRDEYPEAFV